MKNENVRKRKLTREKQRLLLWEKNMGFLSRLFGGNQSNAVEQVRSQPEGFYIVKYEYGEGQARSLFQKAEAGDVNAQLTIAKCFMDVAEQPYALPWYERAAQAGSSQALHELTYFYEGRYVGVEADPEKAEQVRREALEMNNPEAILKLASQYYSGDGVEKDKEMAFKYYMKAAELGNDEAMAEVGMCYLNGEGVNQSDSQAFAWLSKSNDTCYGYYNLAQCYIKGIGTSKNLERGVSYLERAVEGKCLHLSEERRQLVDLYSKGYGGPDAKRKMGEIQEEINQSDKLMDELAALILSDSNN